MEEDSGTHTAASSSSVSERNGPPVDDCCPICFGSFSAPCRGPCGHWYCGGCIIEYWNHVAAFRPCKCPMCSRLITKLTPEATLYQQQHDDNDDAGTRQILRSVRQYNCLFVGGACGFVLQVLQLPLFLKRLIQAMMDPDRPVAYLSRLRLVAVLLGALYTLSPFDFLPRWRYLDAIDLFDCSAIALSFGLYFVGLYSRRRRLRRLRQLDPASHFEVDM
ncbi:putative transcription factor C2H2 family [Helianthus annuus]|uniref:Putative zinc finger, RING/FYVE/PHD-type n=1 Tax=Helianthus annuus TaxID=4232 RepID=A0A251UIY0_HELAN|nr:E3 ubiquitin-protein ligase RNF170 isoform X1 [Helianthus annuus]KAF5803359.1 putative transcription factor C2H2 family [Helianthus annuus]KAJ0567944.1 putative transcription factor C2H2 family [Helianthus annuus]KAJ0741603.1 putative transcription factor C2H2 family [Helianthus annuus]KAJ0912904.1 putative transcription factor C2H2 family [Helianthus annuus]KAJ0916377.1 putative transcription factor C2H2 family [Helianthus annuus]